MQTLLQAYANPEDDFMWGTRPTVNAGSMYFCEDGITFLFNPYELGSFASGLREITIPYEELAPILLLDVAQ